MKILIVDDSKTIHAYVKGLFGSTHNVQFTDVFNGADAVELLKTNKDFDLILLDWEMPVLTGPEAFAEFKKLGIQIPTMMMTTKNLPEDIQMMLNMGVSEYLMKPFTQDILFEKIAFVTGQDVSSAA